MGFHYLFFLPVTLPSVVPRLATDSAVTVFPGVWKLLSFLRLPFQGRSSVPTSFVFLSFIFFHLLFKTTGCFSECLMSSTGIQKLFCGIYSAFKCSYDEFVGEKVVSLSYSSAILGQPSHFSILAWEIPCTRGLAGPRGCTESDMTEATQHIHWMMMMRDP